MEAIILIQVCGMSPYNKSVGLIPIISPLYVYTFLDINSKTCKDVA